MNSKQSKRKHSPNPVVKVKIKEEQNGEILTMEHYVGDPVEMIKQIFATLNTKTIKNLAPDHLKKSSIETIEELCLNELLGISSKRLKSIINDTKCPTDTESDDSDIEHIEHISLEEISSESENERNVKKGKKKKTKANQNEKKSADEKGANGKEMSILELLELQARARAIRSQLALEPIAKIEVKSDDESHSDNSNSAAINLNNQKSKKHSNKNPTPSSSSTASTSTASASVPIKNAAVEKPKSIQEKPKKSETVAINGTEFRPRKIKINRNNFKKRTSDSEEKVSNSNDNNVLSDKVVQEEIPSGKVDENVIKSPEKMNEPERSPSPDVLTIIPNYEILCISDSDDNDNNDENKEKKTISNAAVEKCNENENIINENNSTEKTTEVKNMEENHKMTDNENEEGELIDNEQLILNENQTSCENNTKNKTNDESESSDDSSDDASIDSKSNKNKKVEENSDNESTSKNIDDKNQDENITTKNANIENDDDNHNDDIISLDGEDLDYDMQNTGNKTVEIKSEKIDDKNDEDKDEEMTVAEKDKDEEKKIESEPDDFIELHDSNDEDDESNTNLNQDQSWNTRWLKSSKVSKILATSKLANRVRDNRIKSTRAKKQQQQQKEQEKLNAIREEVEREKNVQTLFFEDGTINQYKEILNREK